MSTVPSGGGAITPDTTVGAYRIPISVIEAWPVANNINPDRRTWLVPYAIFLSAFSTILLGMRLYSRLHKTVGRLATDDGIVAVAWVLAIWFTSTAIYGVANGGLDRHAWDVPPVTAVAGALTALLADFAFTWSTVLTKLSILFFHCRLMTRSNNKPLVHALYAGMIMTVAYGVCHSIYLFLACTPLEASWLSQNEAYTHPYHCIYRGVWDPVFGGLSMLSDLYAIVLPGLLVHKLQVTLKQKVMLSALFSCGILTVGSGIARAVWIRRLWSQTNRDITWIVFETLVWSISECHLALVCASAPALKAFFDAYATPTITKVACQRNVTLQSEWASDDAFANAEKGYSYADARKGSVQTPSLLLTPESSGKKQEEQGIVVSTRFSFSSHAG